MDYKISIGKHFFTVSRIDSTGRKLEVTYAIDFLEKPMDLILADFEETVANVSSN